MNCPKCETICKYKEKCTSFGWMCGSCQNNTGKRNYYKAAPVPYYPQPWIPLPYWRYEVTCDTATNSSHYTPIQVTQGR